VSFATANRKPLSRYRPPPHRSLRPLPPRWTEREREFARSPLSQFLLLSMLIHALAIMLFGAPSGGSREGRAMWGSLQVVLKVIPGASPEARQPVIPGASPEAMAGNPVAPAAPPILDIHPDVKLERIPRFKVPPPSEARLAPAPRIEKAAPEPEAPAIRIAVPAPLVAPSVAPRPIELQSAPRLERPAPTLAAPLVQPLAPATRASAEERPLADAPAITAAPTVQPVEAPPTAVRRVEVPPPVGRSAPVESARVEPLEAPALRPSPFRPPSPSTDSIGRREDEPSSTYDPTAPAPTLDADALRKRAGELARQGSGQRALLAFPMPPIPEKKSKLESAIEKARKPDCRTAYQSLGLAAVLPLIANEFGEGSCRW
jgi:hypothetical protein